MQQTFSGARWSLGLYFGWLLSLPLHGPVLGALSASHSADIDALTSVFTLSHAVGLLATGLLADEKDSPVYRKLGVCSKQELLSIVIRSFNSPGFREAAPGS